MPKRCPNKYGEDFYLHVDDERHEVVLSTHHRRYRFTADQAAALRDVLTEAVTHLTTEEGSP